MPTFVVIVVFVALWVLFRFAIPEDIRAKMAERGEASASSRALLRCKVLAAFFGPASLGLIVGRFLAGNSDRSPDLEGTLYLLGVGSIMWGIFRWLIPFFSSNPTSRWMTASRIFGALNGPYAIGQVLGLHRDGMITFDRDPATGGETPGHAFAAITPFWMLVICVVLWALFRWALPRKALAAARELEPAQAAPSVGQLALWGALAMIFSSAALGIAIVYGGMFLLKWGSTDSIAAAESLVARLDGCSSMMQWFSGAWVRFAGVVAAIFAAVYFYRSGKARALAEAARRAEEEARLKHGVRDKALERLPPTPEMEALSRQAQEIVRARAQLTADGAAEKSIRKLDEKLTSLQSELEKLETDRRRVPRLPGCGLRLVAPDTFWGRVGTFFISPGLEGVMGRGTKVVAGATMVAVMAGAVGFPAGSVTPELAERTAGARLALDRLVFGGINTAAAEFDAAVAALPSAEPLTQEEEAEAEALAEEIGSAFEQQLAGHYSGGGPPAPEFKNEFKVRAEAVRGEVMKEFSKRQASTSYSESSFDRKSDAFADAVRESVRPEKAGRPKPVTKAGQDAAQKTATVMKKGGRPMHQRVKAWWATFQVPTRPGTVGHAFASSFAAGVMEGTGVNDTRFQKPPDAELRQAMARGNEARAKHFAADIARGRFDSAMESAIPADPAKDAFHPPADMEAIRSRATTAEATHLRPQSVDLAEHFGFGKNGGREPGALSTGPEKHVKADVAVEHSVERHIRSFGREAMVDAHATFGDHFAPNTSEPRHTPQGRLLSELGDEAALAKRSAQLSPKLGLPHSSNLPVRAKPMPSAKSLLANATRARSFIRLRGFSRIGGVLIGRDPVGTTENTSHVANFQWELMDGNKVRLKATDSDGKTVLHCPDEALDADAVYAALVYAADGRPTAVTMVTADPLMELKILAHPALVDTRVGQAIIDLDRFVDQFAGTEDKDASGTEVSTERGKASMIVSLANQLYQVAWAARLDALTAFRSRSSSLSEKFEDAEKTRDAIRRVTGLDHSKTSGDADESQTLSSSFGQVKQDIAEAIKPPGTLGSKLIFSERLSQTPLREKSEFYAQSLVKVLEAKLSTAGTLQEFWDQVRASYSTWWTPAQKPDVADPPKPARSRTTPVWSKMSVGPPLPEGFSDWAPLMLTPPPAFEIWSGVREKSFALGSGTATTTGLSSSGIPTGFDFSNWRSLLDPKEFGPLEFMLQTAFTSPPRFGEAAKEGEDYSDEHPWEFPALRRWIAGRVKKGVASDPRAAETLRLAKDFTLAQRFFRLALGGHYGEEFPVHQLPALSRALEPRLSPPQRTPRWNARRGQLEMELLAVLEAFRASRVPRIAGPDAELTSLCELVDENVRAESDFRRACGELLVASDRDTPEWERRWRAAWDEAETRQQALEEKLAEKALAIEKLSIALRINMQRAGNEADKDMDSAVLLQIFDRVDHYATAVQIRRSLGVAVDDERALRHFTREEAADMLKAGEEARNKARSANP